MGLDVGSMVRALTAGAVILALVGCESPPDREPAYPASTSGVGVDATTSPPATLSLAERNIQVLRVRRASVDADERLLGVGPDEHLTVKSALVDDVDHSQVVRYERSVAGLPVVGGQLLARFDAAGRVVSTAWNNGRHPSPTSTRPTLEESAAIDIVQRDNPPADTASSAVPVWWNSVTGIELAWMVTSTRPEGGRDVPWSVAYVSMSGQVLERTPLAVN